MATDKVVIRARVMDAGECPMCGFDSLRRVVGYSLTPTGVTTCFDQTGCGRCVNEMAGDLHGV